MRRRVASALVDRHPQNLPVPIGDHVYRRQGHQQAGWGHRIATYFPPAAGLLAAIAGAVLGVSMPSTAVGLNRHGDVELAGVVLPHRAPGTYGGGDAPALVIVDEGGGISVGAATAYRGGVRWSGRCELHRETPVIAESCTFTLGASRYQSQDVLALGGSATWERRYADGQVVSIPLPSGGALTPVPFPIGKP